MQVFIDSLESTINGSAIKLFKTYINKHKSVSKWMLFSDYCFDIKKPYDCITFTIYPHILPFDKIKERIRQIAPSDLKKRRSMNDEIINLYKMDLFFSFSFQIDKRHNYFKSKITSHDDVVTIVDQFINMYEVWRENTPKRSDGYESEIKALRQLKADAKRKTFNIGLFIKIIMTSFFAAYLTFLLTRETTVEIIGWFSDTDNITTYRDGIVTQFFTQYVHNLCYKYIGEDYQRQQITFSDGDGEITNIIMNSLEFLILFAELLLNLI